jgi:hypothetical protein
MAERNSLCHFGFQCQCVIMVPQKCVVMVITVPAHKIKWFDSLHHFIREWAFTSRMDRRASSVRLLPCWASYVDRQASLDCLHGPLGPISSARRYPPQGQPQRRHCWASSLALHGGFVWSQSQKKKQPALLFMYFLEKDVIIDLLRLRATG